MSFQKGKIIFAPKELMHFCPLSPTAQHKGEIKNFFIQIARNKITIEHCCLLRERIRDYYGLDCEKKLVVHSQRERERECLW